MDDKLGDFAAHTAHTCYEVGWDLTRVFGLCVNSWTGGDLLSRDEKTTVCAALSFMTYSQAETVWMHRDVPNAMELIKQTRIMIPLAVSHGLADQTNRPEDDLKVEAETLFQRYLQDYGKQMKEFMAKGGLRGRDIIGFGVVWALDQTGHSVSHDSFIGSFLDEAGSTLNRIEKLAIGERT